MTNNITLTETILDDLHALFEFQRDEEASYLAAFTSGDINDKEAYFEKYKKLLIDPTITMRTIKLNGAVVGSVAKYIMFDAPQITYGVDKKLWGHGIATFALKQFLDIEKIRPLYGRTAFDNHRSQKVLEKCGFVKIETHRGFANARQAEIEEFVYKLSG